MNILTSSKEIEKETKNMTWEIFGEDKRQEGRQKEKLLTVLRMLDAGKSKEEAAITSGLTIQEVEELFEKN